LSYTVFPFTFVGYLMRFPQHRVQLATPTTEQGTGTMDRNDVINLLGGAAFGALYALLAWGML